MPTLLEALRAVYTDNEPEARASPPEPEPAVAPPEPDGAVLRRIRVPLAQLAPPPVAPTTRPYDSLLDRPTGFIVVDPNGREVARYPRFLERAKHRFDRVDFATGCVLQRLPDRHPMAIKKPISKRDFDDL